MFVSLNFLVANAGAATHSSHTGLFQLLKGPHFPPKNQQHKMEQQQDLVIVPYIK